MTDTVKPTKTQAWQALQEHYEEIKGKHLRQLFADDPGRADGFAAGQGQGKAKRDEGEFRFHGFQFERGSRRYKPQNFPAA